MNWIVLPHSYAEVLTSKVTVFEDKAFREVKLNEIINVEP